MSLILLGILNSQVSPAGAPAYDLLETQVLSSTAASVTFTGLGSYSDYKHLQLRMVTKNTNTGGGQREVDVRFNSDSSTSYAYHQLRGNGSSVDSSAASSQAQIRFENLTVEGNFVSGGYGYGVGILDILDFSSSNKNTTVRAFYGNMSSYGAIYLASGLWNKTNAVTSISLENTAAPTYPWAAGCRFSLYGVR